MYFSGFCLANEKELFKQFIIENDFTVSGFSYGAINALEYTIKQLKNNKRIDKLQLFSPAYFVNKSTKYKRLQLMFYKKNEIEYRNNFIKNIAYPSNINLDEYLVNGTYEKLDTLLNYNWNYDDMQYLINKNVIIEVYLGSDDKIIDANIAKIFFKNFAELYYIKNVGHILK